MRYSRRGGRSVAITAVAVVAVLGLAGCASEATGGSGAGGAGGAGSDAASAPAASTATPAPEVTQQAAPLTGAECIVGSWLLDNASFGEIISSYADGVVDDVTGTVRFRADADGNAVTEYIDWTNTIRMTNPAGVVTMVRNGQDAGTYHAEADGRLSLTETANESVIVVEMTSGGTTMAMPTVENSPGALHLAVFTCTGDELTVTVDDRSSVLHRE